MVAVLYAARWSIPRIEKVLWSGPRSDPGSRLIFTVGQKPWRASLNRLDRLGNFRARCSGPTAHRLEESVAELVRRSTSGNRPLTVAVGGAPK